ncbi:hypothetical protein JCM4814A_94110 [Streptomyces phaeofaciens JCM 4814]|uniref:Uncharacterized protein n=2 Tax=Streptomyces phaeofaciens TaxID=68254 RepID=A0A918HRF3_9ACTN|nr:hypothetical protein GCM10010226_90300 [Streptomyces phaeofaciens]
MGETPASSDDETEEKEAAERRRKRRQMLWQLLLDWSPVLAELTKIVVQHLS